MAKKTKNKDIIKQNKVFCWIVYATGLVLLIPLVLTLLNPTSSINGGRGGGWDWEPDDFLIMGALIFGTGFIFVHVARRTPRKYRTLIAIGFLVALIWLWVELAVGLFTNWGS